MVPPRYERERERRERERRERGEEGEGRGGRGERRERGEEGYLGHAAKDSHFDVSLLFHFLVLKFPQTSPNLRGREKKTGRR
jgi:hypothetical protein